MHYNTYMTQVNHFKITLYHLSCQYWTVTATCMAILITDSTITAECTIVFNISHVPIYASYGPLLEASQVYVSLDQTPFCHEKT